MEAARNEWKGLQGTSRAAEASKQARKGERESQTSMENSGRRVRGTATRREVSRRTARFYFRESEVGGGAHDEEVSWGQAVGVIQESDNKRQESGRCHEKGERLRITPKLSLKEFGNQLGIWD